MKASGAILASGVLELWSNRARHAFVDLSTMPQVPGALAEYWRGRHTCTATGAAAGATSQSDQGGVSLLSVIAAISQALIPSTGAQMPCYQPHDRCPPRLTALVDCLAAHCLLRHGCAVGFNGATLIVRAPQPGTEWLGQPAVPSAIEDDPVFYAPPELEAGEHLNQALPFLTSGADAVAYNPHSPRALATPRPQHAAAQDASITAVRPRGYRCLSDALQAAQDGDTIVLQKGVHPTGGCVDEAGGLRVDKRLLIKGDGLLGQVTNLMAFEHGADELNMFEAQNGVIKEHGCCHYCAGDA